MKDKIGSINLTPGISDMDEKYEQLKTLLKEKCAGHHCQITVFRLNPVTP